MEALIRKHDFLGLDATTWLYSGAETPPLRAAVDATMDYWNARALGPAGRARNAEIELECKARLAQLSNGDADQIALLSNSSEVIALVAQSLDLQPGDNVVINTLEFPSGVLPWLAQQSRGIETRVVEHRGWEVSVDDIMAQVDDRTRLVMTSHVSYISGARIDYRALYDRLKTTNTLLFLDVTQSLGVIPVDMQQTDFLVCSSYKWLLTPHGLGILGLGSSRVHEFVSRAVGWRSISDMFSPTRFKSFTYQTDARRFEQGFPSYLTVYSMNAALQYLLDLGVDRIEPYVLALGSRLIARLQELGCEIMTPVEPSHRAGNIAIVCADGEAISAQLQSEGIMAWGGDGRLRASIHLFNDEGDIDRYADALARILHAN